ncbi:MAG: hypothetical protein QM756_05280 [Polyangiaceae bacterium]
MVNPYAPPSRESDDAEVASSPAQRRARVQVAMVAVVSTAFDAYIMANLGRVSPVIVGRTVLTTALLFGVYLGRNWARRLLIVLFAITAFANLQDLHRLGWSFWGRVSTAWIVSHVLGIVWLAWSPPLRRLTAASRRRVHVVEEDADTE